MSHSAFYEMFSQFREDRISTPFIYRDNGRVSLHFDFSATQSSMLESEPHRLFLCYTHTMMACLLFNPQPASIGMIGLGGGSLAKYCYHHFPETRIDVAEINPEVIAMRETFSIPPDNGRFKIHCRDGAEFMAETTQPYDWLMVDGFDINGQSPSLVTTDFYEDCHAALSPDGVLVVNLDGYDRSHNEYIGTLRQCFDKAVLVVRSVDHSNKIAFAFKDRAVLSAAKTWLDTAQALDQTYALDLKKTARALQQALQKDKPFL